MTSVDVNKVIQKLQARIGEEVTARAIQDTVVETLNEKLRQGSDLVDRILQVDFEGPDDGTVAILFDELRLWAKEV